MKKRYLLMFLISSILLGNPKVIVKVDGDISQDFLYGIKIGVESSNYSLFEYIEDKEDNNDDEDNDKKEEKDSLIDIAKKNNVKIVVKIKIEGKNFNLKVINLSKQDNLLYYVNKIDLIKEENFKYNAQYSEVGKLTVFAKKLIKNILNKKTPQIITKTVIKEKKCKEKREKKNSDEKYKNIKHLNLKIGLNGGFLKQHYVDPYVIGGNSFFLELTFNLDYNVNNMVSFFTELSFNKSTRNHYRSEVDQYISLNMLNLKVGTSISLKDYFIHLSLGRELLILEHMNITSFNYGVELGKKITINKYNLEFYGGISYGYYDHSVIIYNDHTRDIRDTGYEVPIYFGVRYSFY